MRVDARLQVLYLVAVGIGLFLTTHAAVILGLLVLQVLLWLGAGLPPGELARAARRVLVFFLFLTASYALFPERGEADLVPLLGSWLVLSPSALQTGALMSARILAVIYASLLIQRKSGTALVEGLRGLGVPVFVACALDITLALLALDDQAGRGGRRAGGVAVILRRAVKGDIGFLLELIEASLDRAKQRAAQYAGTLESRRELSDLAVVSALTLLSMAVKFIKVMPGLPIAPGHKGVILIPLYVLASELTYSRWGSTKTGVVIGLAAFLMGDGKFGVFELFKYITPGLVVDLAMPVIHRASARPGVWTYAILGVAVAVARFSTIVLVALFVDAPRTFYALLAPIGVAHCVFGFVSGFVTFHLMRSTEKLKALL